jgi:hypothetical protein
MTQEMHIKQLIWAVPLRAEQKRGLTDTLLRTILLEDEA